MEEDREKIKSDRILEEVKRRKDREKILYVEEKKAKLMIFSLLEDYYAFHGTDVKEILPLGKITPVPGSHDLIMGIINVRGDIESVFDIHKCMGIPNKANSHHSRVVIAAKEDIRSGILVDSVEDVIEVSQESIKPPLSNMDASIKDFILGETSYNNKNVTLLDVGKIFKRMAA